jgi:ankyrin repeat protein
VILLLTAGAPVNCRVTEDLSTPLHKACAGGKPGHLSAVKQLLGAGGDVHALNKWRETPLLTAANHGQAASVEALLQNGADPCKCTDTGWSPLSIAAYKGHDDVVRILLEEGAPTEEADPTLSALLQAATKGLPDTVDLLLRHGADHTVTTKKGDTALSILVEQNLIDAAVEMVTEYKASVPRCSRDRKKVQRARLLINLQLKKQQREGNVSGSLGVDSDDSENDESTDSPCAPLHDEAGKKKKGKHVGGPNAEEMAAAAEAALLEELEQEEVQKEQEQAASSKKSAKKKKKKEKERMLKVKEEKERMEREKSELQVKERLRMQKMKEEKAKREREKQEREALEQAERERELARDKVRKTKEEGNRRQREQEKKERERKEKLERKSRAAKATSASRGTNNVSPTPAGTNNALQNRASSKNPEVKAKITKSGHLTAASPAKRRGWETKPESANIVPAQVALQHPSPFAPKPESDDTNNEKSALVFEQNMPPSQVTRLQTRGMHNGRLMDPQDPNVLSNSTGRTENIGGLTTNVQNAFSVDAHIESMATGMVESFLDTDSPCPVAKSASIMSRIGRSSPQKGDMLSTVGSTVSFMPAVVHPYIASFRQDKLESLLRACHHISTVGKDDLGAIFYRWTLRAAHGSSPSLDNVIPSWNVSNELVNFFQRQLISESRRSLDHGAVLNIEYLRETGATIAELCLVAAKEVVQCRNKIEEQMFSEWTDSSIGMNRTSLFDGNGNGESMISIDWQGRSSVQVTVHVFASLERRYCGPPQRFLAAMFNVAKRYETQRMLATGNFLEKRLSPTTMECLRKELSASVQGFSDPLTAPANSLFCGIFPDVDIVFGGLDPLGKDGSGSSLFENGCSLALVTASENIVASRYCHFLVDMLEQMDRMVPLSFAVVFPFESFHDLKGPPKYSDLPSLDARLGGRQGVYVKTVEELPAGKHCFVHGDLNNSPGPSRTGSLLVLLQNEGGSRRYPTNDVTVLSILGSMRPTYDSGTSYQPTLSAGSLDFQMRPGSTAVRSQLNENAPFTTHLGTPVQASRGFVGLDSMPPNTPTSPFNSNTFSSYGGGVLSGATNSASNSRRVRLFDLVDDDDGDENDHSVDVVSGMLSNLGVNMFENTSGQDIDIDIEAISLLGLGNNGSSAAGNKNGSGDRNNHKSGSVGPDPFNI